MKNAVMMKPSFSYSRYTTHRYLGLTGALSHQRNAKSSSFQPSMTYSGSSIVLRSSFRYSGRVENSGCSNKILSNQTFEVNLRITGLYETIVSRENLYRAAYMASKGRRYRDSTADFNFHLEEEVEKLHMELIRKTYRHGRYRTFTVYDPKEREIAAAPDASISHQSPRHQVTSKSFYWKLVTGNWRPRGASCPRVSLWGMAPIIRSLTIAIFILFAICSPLFTSAAHALGYYGGSYDGYSMGIASNVDVVSISSAADQTFVVGDSAAAISAATVTQTVGATGGGINTTDDIRIKIPASLYMTWDETDATAAITGGASSKVSTAVTYEDANKTLVIDVTTNFANGDSIVVSGLSFKNFTSTCAARYLELEIDNAGTTAATDNRKKTISLPARSAGYYGGSYDGWSYAQGTYVPPWGGQVIIIYDGP
jgi:hypothetical protein